MDNFDEILKQLEEQLETLQTQKEEQPKTQTVSNLEQEPSPISQQDVDQSNQLYFEVELQRFIAKHPDIPNLHQLLPHIIQKAQELYAYEGGKRPFADYLEQGLIEVVRTLASITKDTLSSLSFSNRTQQVRQPAQPVNPKEAVKRFYEDYYNILKKSTIKNAYVDGRINDDNGIRELKGSGLLKLGDKLNLD